jgi:hypothetical protein
MNHKSVIEALTALGFTSGWVVTNGKIELWENSAPQPTKAELIAAGAFEETNEL